MPYRDIHKLKYYWFDTVNKKSHYSQYGRNCTAYYVFRCRKIVRNCKQLSTTAYIYINVIQFNKSDGRR